MFCASFGTLSSMVFSFDLSRLQELVTYGRHEGFWRPVTGDKKLTVFWRSTFAELSWQTSIASMIFNSVRLLPNCLRKFSCLLANHTAGLPIPARPHLGIYHRTHASILESNGVNIILSKVNCRCSRPDLIGVAFQVANFRNGCHVKLYTRLLPFNLVF